MEFIEIILAFLLKKQVCGTAITIASAILLNKLSRNLISKVLKKKTKSPEEKKTKTLVLLFQNIVKYLIIIIAFIIILELFGVDTQSFIAGLGIIGIVIGLALQDILKDIIMGITILAENYFVVGDIVTINNFTGKIVEFGLRTTKLQNEDGDVLCLANRNISTLINVCPKARRIVIDIPTAYTEKTSKVEKTIEKIIKNIIDNTSADEESEYAGITSYTDNYINYTISIHCPKEDQAKVKSYALKVIKEIYEKENIKTRGI